MIGIDEVGRGAWAGPLLVCAARLKSGKKAPKGLADSKKLSKKQREMLYPKIMNAFDIGEGWVAAEMIDELGLTNALKSACMLSVLKLDAGFDDEILLDGTVDYFKDSHFTNVTTEAKADDSNETVSAAAIAAKVMRDKLMEDYKEDYPDFGFASHVGYGTAQHRKAIQENGITPIHRKSFKPIRDLGW